MAPFLSEIFATCCIHTSLYQGPWRWDFLSSPRDTGFVCFYAGLTCGMYCVTFAVFHGLLLSHYGMTDRWCWPAVCSRGGPLKQRDTLCPNHCQLAAPPFHPKTWHLYLLAGYASHTPTNLYAWGFTAIFVPSTAASREQEAPCIPVATGHWVFSIEVGEHGSSSLSPDWWMACLTLSVQDGRWVGWGPEIVTPDCFIRVWLIELSSSQSKVPRHLVQRSTPPPPTSYVCHVAIRGPWAACLLAPLAWCPPPTHPGTDTLTNLSQFISSTLGC